MTSIQNQVVYNYSVSNRYSNSTGPSNILTFSDGTFILLSHYIGNSANLQLLNSSNILQSSLTGSSFISASITKYSSNGFTILWTARILSSTTDVTILSIASDSNNNVYLTGTNRGGMYVIDSGNTTSSVFTTPSTSDAILIRFNSNGVYQWNRQPVDFGNQISRCSFTDASSVYFIVDTSNSILTISGSITSNLIAAPTRYFDVSSQCMLLKYNQSGIYQNISNIVSSMAGPRTNCIGRSDISNNLYITGNVGRTSSLLMLTNFGYISPDSFIWRTCISNNIMSNTYDVQTNGSIWVAGGQGTNTLAYSYDGLNWIGLGIAIFSTRCNKIGWNGTLWIAVGQGTSHTIATSPNGITWTGRGVSIFSTTGNSVLWNSSLSTWFAVGSGTNTLAKSTDGINWTTYSATPILPSSFVYGIKWNGSMWVVGSSGTSSLLYSTNGISWSTTASVFSSGGRCVGWNGSIWIAGGSGTNVLATSTNGINWTARTSNLSSSCNAVEWNGSMWVAVGQGTNNSIEISTDGITWTGRGNTIFTIGNGVTYDSSKNLWVAVGQGTSHTIATSTDGINWIGRGKTIFTTTGSGVAKNGSLFVAVGQGTNSIAYSSDGINWTGIGTTIFTSGGSNVAWDGSIWIATGGSNNSVAVSSNGISWAGRGNIFNICYGLGIGNGQVMIGNNSGRLLYSSDTVNWFLSDTCFFTTAGYNLVSDGSTVIACGEGNTTIIRTTDGNNWATSASALSFSRCNDVAFNGSIWVAVGRTTNTILSSTNGLNWTARSSDINATYGADDVVWFNSQFIVIGTNSSNIRIFTTSTDGINWITRTPSKTVAGRIIASNNNMIIASGSGSSNTIMTSIDGYRWTGRGAPINPGYSIGWGNNLWVMGGQYTGTSTIATSSDGINWTQRSGIFSIFCHGVGHNGSYWIATGEGTNTIARSTDGLTWTGLGSNTVTSGRQVRWFNGMWFVVGYRASTNHSIYTSTDGSVWTGRDNTVFTYCQDIAWNGSNLFVAVGTGNSSIAVSSDGFSWTGLGRIIPNNGNGVIWDGSKFIAVGDTTIYTSTNGTNWTARSSVFTNAYGITTHQNMVIVSGTTSSTDYYEQIAISYNGIDWIRPQPLTIVSPQALAVIQNIPHTVYNIGNTVSSLTIPGDNNYSFLIKYDNAGSASWRSYIKNAIITSIVTDLSGNVYQAGTINTISGIAEIYDFDAITRLSIPVSATGQDNFIVKYTSTGRAEWFVKISGNGAETSPMIKVDASRNILVGGVYNSQIGFYDSSMTLVKSFSNSGNNDYYIAKYNPSGNLILADGRITNINTNSWNVNTSIGTNNSNEIYVQSQTTTTGFSAIYSNNESSVRTISSVGGYSTNFVTKYSEAQTPGIVIKNINTNIIPIINNIARIDLSFNEDISPNIKLFDLSNTDPANPTVTYQFSDSVGNNTTLTQNILTISGSSVFLNQAVDFETTNYYSFYIRANGTNALYTNPIPLNIYIRNVAPTQIIATNFNSNVTQITNNGSLIDISFNDNLTINTKLFDLSNDDPNGASTTYYLFTDQSGNNPTTVSDVLTISGWSVWLNQKLNSLIINTYSFNIKCFDISNGLKTNPIPLILYIKPSMFYIPTNITIIKNNSSLELSWIPINAENIKYRITYSTDISFNLSTTIQDISTSNYIINNLIPSTRYYVKVGGYDLLNSEFSDSIITYTLPLEPIVTFTNITTDSAEINWNDISGAIKYNIKLRQTTDFSSNIVRLITDHSLNTFTFTGLESGNKYYFNVIAINENNDKSIEINNTNYFVTLLQSVATIRIAEYTSNTIDLSWNQVSDATKYSLSYTTNQVQIQINNILDTFYRLSNLSSNTNYTITIYAENNFAESTSNGTNITVKTLLNNPSNFKIDKTIYNDISNSTIVVSWLKSIDASGYTLDFYTDSNFIDLIERRIIPQFNNTYGIENYPNLKPGTQCYFRINAYNSIGTSTYSYANTTVPKAVVLNLFPVIYTNDISSNEYIEAQQQLSETISILNPIDKGSEIFVDIGNNTKIMVKKSDASNTIVLTPLQLTSVSLPSNYYADNKTNRIIVDNLTTNNDPSGYTITGLLPIINEATNQIKTIEGKEYALSFYLKTVVNNQFQVTNLNEKVTIVIDNANNNTIYSLYRKNEYNSTYEFVSDFIKLYDLSGSSYYSATIATNSEFVVSKYTNGSLAGDPHVVTINGLAYDLANVDGNYLLFDNNNQLDHLRIIARCTHLTQKEILESNFVNNYVSNGTFVKYLSVEFKGTKIIIDMDKLLPVKGSDSDLLNNNMKITRFNNNKYFVLNNIYEDKDVFQKNYGWLKKRILQDKLIFNGKSRNIILNGEKLNYQLKLSCDLNCADHRTEVSINGPDIYSGYGALISPDQADLIDKL